MNCPVCKDKKLLPNYKENLFPSHTCNNCGGRWLLIEDYVSWKKLNPNFDYSSNSSFKVIDTKKALLCPVSGRIMHKYKIAHGIDHKLDYSPSAGGIWLDGGEWDFLKERDLAGSLNDFLSSQWQNAIRNETAAITFSKMYEEKFGNETYSKLKTVREWINNHPRKNDLRAYILDENPYSAIK